MQVDSGWVTRIPTFGQMILGFTLPFALAFVAIPLEYFVGSGRIVLGASLTLSLRGVGVLSATGRELVLRSRQAGDEFL